MGGRYGGAVADGLGAVFVGAGWGIVGAINLESCRYGEEGRARAERTLTMASLTRSDLTRPFRARLATRLSLDVPELRQAIPKARIWM